MKFTVIIALIALTYVAHAAVDDSVIEKRLADFKATHGKDFKLKISEQKLEQYKKIINEKLPAHSTKFDQEKVQQKLLHKVEMMSKKLELLDGGKFDELRQLMKSRK